MRPVLHRPASRYDTDQYGPDARPFDAGLLTGLGSGGATDTGIGEWFAALHNAGAAFFAIATGLSLVATVSLYGWLRHLEFNSSDVSPT